MSEYMITAKINNYWYRETHSLFGMVLFKECWDAGHGLQFEYVLSVLLYCSTHLFNFFLHRYSVLDSGCRSVADYLITQMDPKWTDRDGSTLLHFACR